MTLSFMASAAGSTVYFVYDPAPVKPTIPIPNTATEIPVTYIICFLVSLAALGALIALTVISLKKGGEKK